MTPHPEKAAPPAMNVTGIRPPVRLPTDPGHTNGTGPSASADLTIRGMSDQTPQNTWITREHLMHPDVCARRLKDRSTAWWAWPCYLITSVRIARATTNQTRRGANSVELKGARTTAAYTRVCRMDSDVDRNRVMTQSHTFTHASAPDQCGSDMSGNRCSHETSLTEWPAPLDPTAVGREPGISRLLS